MSRACAVEEVREAHSGEAVFRALRQELEIPVPREPQRLPEVQTEEEMRRFYQAVGNCRNFADMVLIKTLFYTGVRVSELVALRLDEVDLERCQIRITQGKGNKDRQVPFPPSFRELLALHMERMRDKGAVYLFESVRKHKYTDRGVRKMLARYAHELRNEIVEELIADRVSESCAEQDAPLVRSGRTRRMESEKGRR